MALLDGLAGLAGLGSQNPYGPLAVGEWNLARGVYTRSDTRSMVFFFETKAGENPNQKTAIDQINDTGGRRLAVYEYPYKDGQRVKDLGRRGETVTFNLKFFGLDYQRKFQEFLDVVVNSSLGGTVVHPVRGAMAVRFREYDIIHRFDEWNAVTIKAVFIEDNSTSFGTSVGSLPSVDASLRNGVQILADVQAFLSKAINDANLILVAKNTLKQRLQSVLTQVSTVFGELIATFGSDVKLKSLISQASETTGGLTALSSGSVSTGSGSTAALPPILQTGFDANTQTMINAQTSSYVAANQVTPQQAVFSANQARQNIKAAITELEGLLGLQAFDMVLTYRQLAVAIQASTEASLSSQASLVKIYVTPQAMSLRQVAANVGLDYGRQNDLEALNPYLQSVNYIAAGTPITVPAA